MICYALLIVPAAGNAHPARPLMAGHITPPSIGNDGRHYNCVVSSHMTSNLVWFLVLKSNYELELYTANNGFKVCVVILFQIYH